MDKIFEVAVNAPIGHLLSYQSTEKYLLGQSVYVPLKNRKAKGIVFNTPPLPPSEKIGSIKTITSINSERPLLSSSYLQWAKWLSKYYVHPLGQILNMAFPPLQKSTGHSRKKEPKLSHMEENTTVLTDQQKKIVKALSEDQGFSTHLLHGITGSGKTEIYLELIEIALRKNKATLVLVPEISLTPQILLRFSKRFGKGVAILHSNLTSREKTNQWWSVQNKKKRVLIGTRSALFCPIPNLGLIIVDEEHETSFKQESGFRYHARDAAIIRARFEECKILLGSATPSLESWVNAKEGKYHLHKIEERFSQHGLPCIEVIDLKNKNKTHKECIPEWMSEQLFTALKDCHEKGEQAALFLNRRGVAPTVLCKACGSRRECPNCSICLTLHGRYHLTCHYCNYHENLADICSECGSSELQPLGLGTERLEADLSTLFPSARIFRADRDEVTTREQMEDLIVQMERQEIDILIGTQMIAKGLDFPNLTLVGIVLADLSFNLPDFRATEKSFQLLLQMSGRPGRSQKPGHVIAQTYNPEHIAIQKLLSHDVVGFLSQEQKNRKELLFPPFGRLALLKVQSQHKERAEKAAYALTQKAKKSLDHSKNVAISVLGPCEAPIFKLNGKYRFHILIKGPRSMLLNTFCSDLIESTPVTGVKTFLDIDPIVMS